MTSAGAVAKDGMAMETQAANSMDTRKSTAVTTAVKPVLPPTATPAEDSTNVVVVEVPRIAPAEVAMESASSAGLILANLPSLSSMSALVQTPTSVPRVSKISTNRNEKMTTIKFTMLMPSKSTRKHCPNVSPSLESPSWQMSGSGYYSRLPHPPDTAPSAGRGYPESMCQECR